VTYGKDAQALWKYLVANVDCRVLLARAVEAVRKGQFVRNPIDMLRELIVAVHDADKIRPCVDEIADALDGALGNEAVEVRKAAVFGYVAMVGVFGPELNPIIERLTRPQQRLIAFYDQQRGA
jgi:hypothetical protein